jgi:hypothetical protein
MAEKNQNQTTGKEPRIGKIKSLKPKKQPVRDLSPEELNKVKGGPGWST